MKYTYYPTFPEWRQYPNDGVWVSMFSKCQKGMKDRFLGNVIWESTGTAVGDRSFATCYTEASYDLKKKSAVRVFKAGRILK